VEEPRLIERMFEANARLREVGRTDGVRSDAYAAALDELERLRRIHDEERLCREAQPRRRGRSTVRTATWVTPAHVDWRE
jgi:hypothetical protein